MSNLFMICSIDGNGLNNGSTRIVIRNVFTDLDSAETQLYEYFEKATYFDYQRYKIVIYNLDVEKNKYVPTNQCYTISNDLTFYEFEQEECNV